MKIISIELHPEDPSNSDPAPIVLSFKDPTSLNPYQIKSADGLDAQEIIEKNYGAAESSRFHDLVLKQRTIVLLMGLNPNFSTSQSYSQLRDAVYKLIATTRTGRVQLQFKNTLGVVAVANGYISKFETNLFEKKQQLQVTVVCDEPLLKAPTPVVLDLLDPDNTIIDDILSTAPHGFSFTATVTSPFSDLSIIDPNDLTWSFEMDHRDGFLIGDIIHGSSELNDKHLYLERGTTITHLADIIVPGSVWPLIFPGTNTLKWLPSAHVVWNVITYYPTYWGV